MAEFVRVVDGVTDGATGGVSDGVTVGRENFIARNDAQRYAVAFDRRGKLGWKTSEIVDEDPGYGGALWMRYVKK